MTASISIAFLLLFLLLRSSRGRRFGRRLRRRRRRRRLSQRSLRSFLMLHPERHAPERNPERSDNRRKPRRLIRRLIRRRRFRRVRLIRRRSVPLLPIDTGRGMTTTTISQQRATTNAVKDTKVLREVRLIIKAPRNARDDFFFFPREY